jgi:hypothetical protein
MTQEPQHQAPQVQQVGLSAEKPHAILLLNALSRPALSHILDRVIDRQEREITGGQPRSIAGEAQVVFQIEGENVDLASFVDQLWIETEARMEELIAKKIADSDGLRRLVAALQDLGGVATQIREEVRDKLTPALSKELQIDPSTVGRWLQEER